MTYQKTFNNNNKKQSIQFIDMKTNIIKVVKKYIEQEQKQILNKNSNKIQSTDNKLKKTLQQQMFNGFSEDQMYDQLVNIADKLRKIKKRINSISNLKIKKQKINLFNPKLLNFITEIENIIETKSMNVKIDKQLSFLIFETNKSLTECDRILTLFEKEFSPFFCGRNQETKFTFYKTMINIVSFSQVWSLIPKFIPVVVEKTSKIQVFMPIKIDYNYLDYQIEKQIENYWPETQIIKEIIQCEREHVDSHIQKIQALQNDIKKIESSISISSSEEQLKNKFTKMPENYVKIQEFQKVKQKLKIQQKLRLAHQKLFGFGRPQQIESAIQIYIQLSKKDNEKISQIYNFLGQIYEQGKFQTLDRQKSQHYYNLSAKLGNPQGLYKIGKYLEKGLINISQKNYKTKYKNQQLRIAIECYQKAAQHNHLDAITDLGYIYENGIKSKNLNLQHNNININTYKSEGEVSQSDKQTVKQSKYFIEPNYKHAVKYYTLAKKQHFPRALNNLGSLLIRQHEYIEEKVKGTNLQKGVKYLKKAAHLNYIKAYNNLGKCYQNGLGVKKDIQEAKSYFLKGSQKRDITCKIEYLKLLLKQKLNQKNVEHYDVHIAKILQLIGEVLILDPKNSQCLYYLGLFYEKGDGVIKNPELAYNYMKQSSQNYYYPALTKLGDYYYSGFYVTKNLQEAFKLYQIAAQSGQSQAMKRIIKPTNGSNISAIKKLNSQALIRNNSNAFLIAGLRQMSDTFDNGNINNKDQLNSKILKSLKMNNMHTERLMGKILQNSENIKYKIIPSTKRLLKQKQKQTQKQKQKQKSQYLIKHNVKTVRYGKLYKVKSSSYLKTQS